MDVMNPQTTRPDARRVTTGLIAVLAVIAAVLAGTVSPAAAETVSDPVSVQSHVSFKCLFAQNYSLENNVPIEQYECGTFSAYWEFVTTSDGYYRIRYK